MNSGEPIDFADLAELIGYLRSKLTGLPPKDTLCRLQDILGDGVTLRYEVINVASNTASGTNTVKTRFSHVEGNKLSRVLLSTHKKTANLSEELYRQLNGIVLQYPTWKVLSVPSPIFNHRFSLKEVAKNIDKYEIYPIIDGTVVTLYWYENSWRLSTTNGYDVTNMRWLSNKTYMEAIKDLVKYYPTFSFERLNPACSYTIGFRHHDFQPLRSDQQKIWFIQSCNTSLLNNLVVTNVTVSKIVSQSTSAINDITVKPMLIINTKDDIGIPVQVPLQFADRTHLLATLQKHNEDALVEFSKSLDGDFVVSPHYGYFLRPKGAGLSDIIMESTLLNLIRKSLYNFPKKRNQGESELTYENRLEYAKLRAYLSGTVKYPFITLFPQFKEDYERFDIIFRRIADRIIQILRRPGDKKNNDQRIEIVAQRFAATIKDSQINVNGQDGLSIVMDLLADKRHLEFYFTFIIVGK